MTPKQQMNLIKQAKELGLASIKIGDVEIVFAKDQTATHKTHAVPDLEAKDILAPPSPFDDLTEEEIQYFATPYYDQLQADKAKKQEAIKENVTNG